MSTYGTVNGGDSYFANKLHATAWVGSIASLKPKALYEATQIIDALSFKGYKASVYAVLLANIHATCAEIRAAEVAQALQFPRDTDTTVPASIDMAAYEIAYELLDGRDPELELEKLSVTSERYAAVGTSYDRSYGPQAHILNGVPSITAWKMLLPFLRSGSELKLSRVS